MFINIKSETTLMSVINVIRHSIYQVYLSYRRGQLIIKQQVFLYYLKIG